MANEVITHAQRYILVQINNETKVERALYQDNFSGMFQPTTTLYNAKSYTDETEAQKVADGINFLYKITSQPFKAYVVNETIDRSLIGDDQEAESANENIEPTSETTV
ncbi:hypothetical protein HMPREF2997_09765 [Staphylococcus sp. HMSC057C08]|uniref:hypothetical protein n=1 Tax=Staphylococcus TaxID=1279 RepID=UPI0008D39BD7|nr:MULTISPECIES: hypothetical protein [Staphylococcus]MDK7928242.1 hypothetical protein [Staphylococcus simulans]OFP25035.1 hypothetical protein HMPREF2997_09765 [Staphylococcus sp. HMSC057C08]VED60389.1 phi PVL ORF 22-like protein [Staphylococcus simulans]